MRYSDIEKDLSEFLLTLLTKIGCLPPRSHPDILLLGHIKKKFTLRFIINGGGGQNKRGGFKDFEKLINGGVKISGGVGQNIEEKRRK